jgi:mannitol/fructose-specific phosphotransferase system IIA component (Ntr-type)
MSGLKFAVPPALDIVASHENEAIRLATDLLAQHAGITHFGGFVDAVFDRQRINPPILGNGVAIPHARTALAREIVCVAARCKDEVPFGPEAIPVRLLFIFAIPLHLIDEYLALTASLVKRLRSPEIIESLLAAETPEKFAALLS